MPSARWGYPTGVRPTSTDSLIIFEPTLGLSVDQPSVDAQPGTTPDAANYIMRDGYLEPRAGIVPRTTNAQPMGVVPITGVFELQSTAAVRYPLASGTTRWAVYGQSATPNGWSVLSYVSAHGLNDPPALASTDYMDFAQIYWPLRDENLAVGAPGSYQSLYCTQSDTTVFSSLTSAPRARFLTAYDNFLLAGNIKTGSIDAVQRIQWSDRGDPTIWDPGQGLAGYEDLLALRGQITRLIGQENRVVVFSEAEIWQGTRGDGTFVFAFQPYDRSVGCPYSWTAVETPIGIIFLAKDYNVYLLPKGGGAAEPIGQKLHRSIRENIDHPERAFALYDNTLSQYQLYYAIKGGSGYPQRAVYLDVKSGAWAPQSYDPVGGTLSFTRATEIYVSSSATTWGGLSAASLAWSQLNQSWSELGGTSEARSPMVGSSAGTLYTYSSQATSDNGTPVLSYWRSTVAGGLNPTQQKTVTEVRIDYQADSASSLTLRLSTNAGASFGASQRLDIPATSSISQAIGYPYLAGRYPLLEVQSEGFKHRLYRFYLKYKTGGR